MILSITDFGMQKIGAAQVAFINPPSVKLDFTDAANIADLWIIEKCVRNCIQSVISGMAVLPNRFLVKLDPKTDYFKAYQPHHGFVRLTIEKGTGIVAPKKSSGMSRLLAKVVKDIPDCYVKVNVGAEAEWRTSTQKNSTEPVWNETHDFLVADFEQAIGVDIKDDDLAGDDDIGIGYTTIKQVLLNGGEHEIALTHKDTPTDAKLTIRAKFYHFVADRFTLSADANEQGHTKDSVCGLVTILVASALNLSGDKDDLNPSVEVTWGGKKFQTAAKTYTPGTDIFNPSFDQAFKFHLTADMVANPGAFRIALMNRKHEAGSVEVPFEDILGAEGMTIADSFDVGSGASVRASISVHGVQRAE
jgi:Ca2+-dependent lipid-binding protein